MPLLLEILGTSGLLGYYAGGYLKGILPFFVFMILTFVLEMGVSGAAMASGISQSLGAVVFIGYFVHKTVTIKPGLRFARPNWDPAAVRAVAVNGSSEFFNSLSAGITTFLFNRLILAYVGALGVAALTVVQYPMMLGVMVIMGIGSGTQPIFSYNHGAGLQRRVRETLLRAAVVSTLVGAVIFFVMGAPAQTLAALFLPGHPEAQALTGEVSQLVRWSMLFLPMAMIASVYFTALEQAAKSLVVALARGLVLPVLGLALFPTLWGANGIWITPIFAEAVAVLIAAGCYVGWRSAGATEQGPVLSAKEPKVEALARERTQVGISRFRIARSRTWRLVGYIACSRNAGTRRSACQLSKKSTSPSAREYSAPTIRSLPARTRSSITGEPLRRVCIVRRTLARTAR